MKFLFFCFCIFSIGIANSQENEVPGQQKTIDLLSKQPNDVSRLNSLNKSSISPAEKVLGLARIRNASGGIITRIQGNMPCLVPDMSEFNMPNAWTGELHTSGPGAMPNSGRKLRIVAIAKQPNKSAK
jgi:hypothetical protein